MKNKKTLFIVAIFALIVIGILGYFIYNKYLNVYKIIYNDMMEPGSISEINIYNDKLKITQTSYSDIPGHGDETRQFSFDYSKENIDKLKKFIDSNFKKSHNNKIEIFGNELDKYQIEVIESLLSGEEDFEIKIEKK